MGLVIEGKKVGGLVIEGTKVGGLVIEGTKAFTTSQARLYVVDNPGTNDAIRVWDLGGDSSGIRGH